jgi:hypothetical protein
LKLIVAIENKLETQHIHNASDASSGGSDEGNNLLLNTMRMTVIGGSD